MTRSAPVGENGNPYFDRLARRLIGRREQAGLLNSDGQLDLGRKYDTSFYEVLTLDHYLSNITDQQGIREPSYSTDEEYREFLVVHVQSMIQDAHVEPRPELIFFLDRSSRPVAWLLRALWRLFADGTRDLPEFKFLSIDANRVFHRMATIGRQQLRCTTGIRRQSRSNASSLCIKGANDMWRVGQASTDMLGSSMKCRCRAVRYS